jgi:hypothetical protein
MPVLLFRLNGVPDDEAEEVRELLAEHNIDWYETDAGRWGISVAALWLRDEAQAATARQLIDEYQEARALRVQGEYQARRAEGREETLLDRFRRDPLRFVFYVMLVAGIVYLMLIPFMPVG